MTVKTGTIQEGRSRIFFRYTDTDAPPILFIHGNSFSSRSFEKQFDSALSDSFRLIAVDLPGHGNSSWAGSSVESRSASPMEGQATGVPGGTTPTENTPKTCEPMHRYSPRGLMDAVLTVVRELHAEHAIFVGWSLGGHLLLEATDRLPRARGFMIFGTPPLGAAPTEETPFTTHPATGLIFKSVLTEEEKNTYLTSIFSPETKTIPPMFREDLEKADGKVREVLGTLAAQASFEDEVAVVNNLPCPLAILHGSRDRLVNPDYIRSLSYNTLWKGKIIDIPGTGHTPQWEHPVLFNSVLTEFDASL